MNQSKLAAGDEWRQHWTLVLASMFGFSFVAIASTTIGLFIEPLEKEFGWSRTEITFGLSLYSLIAVLFSPFVGALIDRWGARRLAIPGLILTATAFSAFSLANGSIGQWFGLWVFYAFSALVIRNTVWTTAISGVFTSARGLALGVTLSGSAITATLGPIVAQRVIDNFGWREAYFWIGAGWGLLVLLLIVPFFYDARDTRRRKQAAGMTSEPQADLPGLSFAQALRSSVLIKIALATVVFVLAISSLSVHLVPILNERGLSREMAALMAAFTGVMAIGGRLITGWILDRWASGWINAGNLAAPAVACVILIFAENNILLIILAVLIVGYTSGAFMQVVAYLTGRYAGIRHFGKIFGVMSSAVALGLGVGPVIAGFAYDQAGNYMPLLFAVIPAVITSGILVFALGPYPDWDNPEQTAASS